MKLVWHKSLYLSCFINLILSASILVSFFQKPIAESNLHIIKFFTPDTTKLNLESTRYIFIPLRNWRKLNLTSNYKNCSEQLYTFKKLSAQIISSKDTLNGLNLIFQNDSEYWTFLESLEICRALNAQSYFVINNNLWLFFRPMNFEDSSKNAHPLEL